MFHNLIRMVEAVCAFGACASLGYYCLCIFGAVVFLREREADGGSTRLASRPDRTTIALPSVSILKPLKGTDPGLYENLRSHCLLDYAQFEIVFGVSDPGDPAIEFVERLKAEFPQVRIQLLVCQRSLGANAKASNLAQMLPAAKHQYIVVNDSDIRVEVDYLRRIVAPLADPKTGLVTCLYRGVASSSLGARLETLFISTDFCPGVLAARLIEGGIHFGLGSTLAFRRKELSAIGGFEALADYLADDYELGRRIAALDLRIELSETVVETFLPAYSFKQFVHHQLRWARTIRDSRPGGYVGLATTFGLPWALLTLMLASGAGWAWGLLAAATVLRYTVAVVVGRVIVRDQAVISSLPLIPFRDCVGMLVWFFGFTGSVIKWRGDSFKLKDGKLVRTGS